jgi:hypothetical protein
MLVPTAPISIMPLTRREALQHLSALLAIPMVRWPARVADPLAGTVVEYQAGRARRDWTAAEVTKQALDRANALNGTLHAVDLFSKTAMDDVQRGHLLRDEKHRAALSGCRRDNVRDGL